MEGVGGFEVLNFRGHKGGKYLYLFVCRRRPYGLLYSPACKSSRRPQSPLGQLKTGYKTSFLYFRFDSKYDRLCHAIIIRSSANYLIGDLKSEIGPAPCDKKCCSEHQTYFARVRGSGHETKPRFHPLGRKKVIPWLFVLIPGFTSSSYNIFYISG